MSALRDDITEGIIEAVVDTLEDTAQWRREKAKEYPHDLRNADAVAMLDALAKEVKILKGTSLHYRLALVSINPDFTVHERLSDFHRGIGFYHFPASGEDYLTNLIQLHVACIGTVNPMPVHRPR